MESPNSAAPSDHSQSEEGFDLLELSLIVVRRWRLIATLTFVLALTAIVLSYIVKPQYTATVSFLVDQESTSSGVFLIRQNDPTLALLQSESITQYVLEHVSADSFAKEVSGSLSADARLLAIRKKIQNEATAIHDEQGVYTVKVQDHTPARAVLIANSYLDALQSLSDHMSFEAATRTRAFYEQQVAEQRSALERAEVELKTHQESTGVILPTSQTNLEISQISTLRSQLVALQVQKATVSQQVTPESPEMVRLNAQISGLQEKINGLQSKISSKNDNNLPSENLEIGRLEREVTYHQSLLASLSTQFERARLQENFSIPRVHVVDRAAPPLPKTYPNRYAFAAIGTALGFFTALLITVLGEVYRHLKSKPESALKLKAIQSEFHLRKA